MKELKIITFSAEETRRTGEILGAYLKPGDLVCLNGELGSGKTVFVSGIAQGLGIGDPVTSPTFTLVNEYQGRIPFFHFDVYRISDPDELYDIGFEEYFYRGGAVCIEWSKLIESILPDERLEVEISRMPMAAHGDKRQLLFRYITADGVIPDNLRKALDKIKEEVNRFENPGN